VRTPSIPTGWKLYRVAGLSEQIALPVPLIIDLIPPTQTLQRPGIRRQQPGYWVQHETANSNPGADADMHRRYMHNGALGESGQPQTLGYHFTNDDHQIFQMVPIDEVTWQAADDAGPGNMSGISNELCINQGIDHAKARHVAEALAAGVLGALGLGADRVKRHWDFNFNNSPDKRHHCPDLMMNENYWPTFVENVGKLLTGQHGGFGSLYPEGLDKGLAARWFGSVKLNDIKYEFSPDGPVSNAWLRLGRYPRLKSVERYDTRTYFRFADGTIIWRPDDKADVRLMGPKAGLTYPEGMDSALAKKWFGRVAANGTKVGFSEDKPLGRMWLGRKRFPRLTDVETDGARTYYRFADGTVAFQPEPDADVRIMGPAAKRGRYPEGLAKERATKWFGAVASRGMRYAFEEDAPVSKLWLGLGRLPKLDRVERYDARTYFRFADGTVIWRPNDEVDLRLLSD